MPVLYEYLGIIIYFWSKEHLPVHVHGKYQGCEARASIEIKNGVITSIIFENVTGKKPLPKTQMKDFKILVQSFAFDIVGKWEAYFNNEITPKRIKITRRLK